VAAPHLTARGDARVDTAVGPVHVPFVLPGETVRVTHLKRRGGRWHGRLAEVLAPSAARRDPPCPLFARCGGCTLMAMAPEAQREHKRARVARAVAGAAEPGEGAPPVHLVVVPDAPDLGYRRRARLTFRRTAQGTPLGYRAHRSHHIVDVDVCAVLAPPLAGALVDVREALAPCLEGDGTLRLHLGAGGRAALALGSESTQPPAVYAATEALVERGALAGATLRVGGATATAHWGDPREHLMGWDGEPLVAPPEGFSQANDSVSRAIAGHVRTLAEPEGARVLELYAGHGNLTVALAPGAHAITAVERDVDAAQACRDNLAHRGTPARVVCADAAEAPRAGPVDVVVLDPPREGAAPALPAVLALRPARVVYVSCDPESLGRDLRALAGHGYVVDRAAAFDMFPHTAHVEAVVRLRR
jgi:23S rRNA (uracil1939-C5)-methyltransferase